MINVMFSGSVLPNSRSWTNVRRTALELLVAASVTRWRSDCQCDVSRTRDSPRGQQQGFANNLLYPKLSLTKGHVGGHQLLMYKVLTRLLQSLYNKELILFTLRVA